MIDAPSAHSALLLRLSGPPGETQQVLEADGLWVTPSYDPAEARHRLHTARPDLLVVEVDGRHPGDWQVCLELSEASAQPMLVVVQDQSTETRLAALASGADDVLARPFHPMELAARVRALLRRVPVRESSPATLRHGDLVLDLDAHLATLHGHLLALTPLEFRLVRTLLESPHRTFSRDELLARVHVFDDRLPADRSIDVHVAGLRAKLGDTAEAPRYVETVRGMGYRLARAAPASRVDTGTADGSPELAGRAALVAGRVLGAGRAIAAALADAGAAIVALGNGADTDALAAELARAGHRAEALACDLAQPGQVGESVSHALATTGGFDILVWSAAGAASRAFQEMDDPFWERLLAANLTGAIQAARAVLPGMLERDWGRIVNVVHASDRRGVAGGTGSCAAAEALLGFTRGLATEVGQRGVTVNAICPSVDAAAGGRPPPAERVAQAVLMLCGRAARGVTGQTIEVMG